MEEISRIITGISVLIAGVATIRLGVGVWNKENSDGTILRYALAMIYTALYAILFSVGAIIQAVVRMIWGA